MLQQRLDLKGQRQVAQVEEVGRAAEIAVDHPLHRHVVVAVAFFEIAQEAGHAVRLDGFELLAHGVQVGGQRELAAVVEHQMIGRVDPLQVEPFAQRRAQRREFGLVDQRHDEQRRPAVEGVAVAGELVATTAGAAVLFEHGHLHAVLGEVRRRCDAADASADDECSGSGHGVPSCRQKRFKRMQGKARLAP